MLITIMALLIFSGVLLIIAQLKVNKRRISIKKRLSGENVAVKKKKGNDEPALARIHKRTSKIINVMDNFEEQSLLKFVIVIFVNLAGVILHNMNIVTFTMKTGVIFSLLSVIIVIIIPSQIKKKVSAQRAKQINSDLPYAIDIMAICIRSGMTIENSFSYISVNFNNINPDIAALFERTALKTEVSGIIEALDQLYDEVPSAEIRMFCSTLQQSVSFGSSIYPILVELSKDIREMQLLGVEEKVASLSAKISAPMIIFIMFPILAIVAGPGFIRMMSIWSN